MDNLLPTHWPQFFTATIVEHKHLLKPDTQKLVIIKSLQFLVNANKVKLYGYSIMSNHVHFIWQPLNNFNLKDIQSMFMKYTARQLLHSLDNHPAFNKNDFKVYKIDRSYQIWKRESLGIELTTPLFFHQKLTYIHNNPVKAGLCDFAETYKYSSAKFIMKVLMSLRFCRVITGRRVNTMNNRLLKPLVGRPNGGILRHKKRE